MTYAVPFSPREEWALTPSLDVVFGVSDPYRSKCAAPPDVLGIFRDELGEQSVRRYALRR